MGISYISCKVFDGHEEGTIDIQFQLLNHFSKRKLDVWPTERAAFALHLMKFKELIGSKLESVER